MYFKKGLIKVGMFLMFMKKKAFKCELNEKDFAIIHYMRSHMARIHKGEKPGICQIYKHACSSKYALIKHIETIHEKRSHF